MFGQPVPEGFLFYGRTRRREAVAFDGVLRDLTAEAATEARRLLAEGRTPPPVYEPRKCDACSLKAVCNPGRLARRARVGRWLASRIEA